MEKEKRKEIIRQASNTLDHFIEASKRGDLKNKEGAFKEYCRLHKQLGVKLKD